MEAKHFIVLCNYSDVVEHLSCTTPKHFYTPVIFYIQLDKLLACSDSVFVTVVDKNSATDLRGGVVSYLCESFHM